MSRTPYALFLVLMLFFTAACGDSASSEIGEGAQDSGAVGDGGGAMDAGTGDAESPSDAGAGSTDDAGANDAGANDSGPESDTDSGQADMSGDMGPTDACPADPDKTDPGLCGCGVADDDTDGDGFEDCIDNCPLDDNPGQEDDDADGLGDLCDLPCDDRDGDGYGRGNTNNCAYPEVDCDDNDPVVHPGAIDLPGDGVSSDCTGTDVAVSDANGVFVADGSFCTNKFANDMSAGTAAFPLRTLDAGLALAESTGKPFVFVSRGSFTSNGSIEKSVIGGYSCDTWAQTNTYVTTIRSTASVTIGKTGRKIRFAQARLSAGSTGQFAVQLVGEVAMSRIELTPVKDGVEIVGKAEMSDVFVDLGPVTAFSTVFKVASTGSLAGRTVRTAEAPWDGSSMTGLVNEGTTVLEEGLIDGRPAAVLMVDGQLSLRRSWLVADGVGYGYTAGIEQRGGTVTAVNTSVRTGSTPMYSAAVIQTGGTLDFRSGTVSVGKSFGRPFDSSDSGSIGFDVVNARIGAVNVAIDGGNGDQRVVGVNMRATATSVTVEGATFTLPTSNFAYGVRREGGDLTINGSMVNVAGGLQKSWGIFDAAGVTADTAISDTTISVGASPTCGGVSVYDATITGTTITVPTASSCSGVSANTLTASRSSFSGVVAAEVQSGITASNTIFNGLRNGVYANTGSTVELANCHVEAANTVPGAAAVRQLGASPLTIVNSIVVGRRAVYVDQGGSVTLHNNDLFVGTGPDTCELRIAGSCADPDTYGSANINADPLATGYLLAAGSPCIDTGVDPSTHTSMSVPDDYSGNPRPFNALWDIGPDEYSP